ncbi:MAG: hypothetical protein ABSE17_03525 [Candidatus Levyibacteriota bacterium]|jgi:hypothetical protein
MAGNKSEIPVDLEVIEAHFVDVQFVFLRKDVNPLSAGDQRNFASAVQPLNIIAQFVDTEAYGARTMRRMVGTVKPLSGRPMSFNTEASISREVVFFEAETFEVDDFARRVNGYRDLIEQCRQNGSELVLRRDGILDEFKTGDTVLDLFSEDVEIAPFAGEGMTEFYAHVVNRKKQLAERASRRRERLRTPPNMPQFTA